MESVAAHCLCRGCKFNLTGRNATHPSSFLKQMPGAPATPLRTWPGLQRDLQEAIAESRVTKRQKILTSHGMNKVAYAFDPKWVPGVNPTNVCSQDVMHLLFDGVTRHESAWMLQQLVIKQHLSWPALLEAQANYRWR